MVVGCNLFAARCSLCSAMFCRHVRRGLSRNWRRRRPLALAGAYTAASGSVDSLYYNPGGLATLDGKELSVTHSDWLEGTSFDLASYGQSTPYGTFAASVLRLGGTQEGRDADRQPTGDFTTQDMAAILSYSKALGSTVGAGANVKYLRSEIGSDKAATFAIDVGAVAHPASRWSVGAAVLNIGSGLQFIDQVDHLPLTLAAGASYRPIDAFTISVDAKHEPYDQLSEVDTGGQYSIGAFDFRAGYAAPVQGPDTGLSAKDHFRGGLGIRISRYRADYTLAPFGDLGLTQRFTLAITFGAEASELQPSHNLQPHALAPSETNQIATLLLP